MSHGHPSRCPRRDEGVLDVLSRGGCHAAVCDEVADRIDVFGRPCRYRRPAASAHPPHSLVEWGRAGASVRRIHADLFPVGPSPFGSAHCPWLGLRLPAETDGVALVVALSNAATPAGGRDTGLADDLVVRLPPSLRLDAPRLWLIEQVERLRGDSDAPATRLWITDGAQVLTGLPGQWLHADALERMLGLATPGPPSAGRYWLTVWLSALLEADAGRCLRDAAGWHPAVDLRELDEVDDDELVRFVTDRHREHARIADWAGIRVSAVSGTHDLGWCSARLAGWFDDGSFARHIESQLPELGDLVALAGRRLGAEVHEVITVLGT